MIFQISCYIIYSIFEVFSDIYKTCIRCCYKRVRNAVLGCKLKNVRVISVHFQDKPFSITVIQVCVSTTNAKEAEVEPFYEDLLELTPKKDVLFIIGDWNAKVGSLEIPGVTGKFGLVVQNEARQKLTEFCQENWS